MIIAYVETRLVDKSSFQGGKRDFCVDLGPIVLADCHISEGECCCRNFSKTFFEGKKIIAYHETRLVEKCSCPREKRECCVDIVLIVVAKL